VNAGVGLRTDDKRYALELWVKNLFDTRYIAPNGSWTQGTATAPASYTIQAQPRYFGSLSARNSTAKHSPARRAADGSSEHEIAFSSAATPVDRHLCGPQSRLWLGRALWCEGRPRRRTGRYLYQFSPLIVAGVEADIEGTGVSTGGHGYAQPGRSLDYDVSFRGRVGVTPLDPRLLIYATGGAANAKCATTTPASTPTARAGSLAPASSGS